MADENTVLRDYRLKHGLSCEEFAKNLGIPEPTLRSLENGTRAITPKRAKEIERLIGIPRAQLRPDIFDAAAA